MTNLLVNRATVDVLPIKHISVSAIREFLTNQQSFYKKYIRLEFDNSTAPSLLIGKAVHSALEKYWTILKEDGELLDCETVKNIWLSSLIILVSEAQKMWLIDFANKEAIKIAQKINTSEAFALMTPEELKTTPEFKKDQIKAEYEIKVIKETILKKVNDFEMLQEAENKYIKWGKTWSLEDCEDKVCLAIQNYFDNLPNYTPLYIEYKETIDFIDMEGQEMPLPIKWVIDLIAEDENGDIVIVDHKIVSGFSDPEEDSAAFEMQAGAYFFIAQAITWKIPKKMIFDEVLKADAKLVLITDPTRKLLQADLRALCDENNIERGKYDKNIDLQEKLLNAGILEYTPTRQPFVVDYTEKPEVIDAFLNIYKAVINILSIQALYDIPLSFLPNPFDQLTGKDSWKDYKETMEIWTNWKQAAADRKNEVIPPDDLDF